MNTEAIEAISRLVNWHRKWLGREVTRITIPISAHSAMFGMENGGRPVLVNGVEVFAGLSRVEIETTEP